MRYPYVLMAAALILGSGAVYPPATPEETTLALQRFRRAAAMSYMAGRSGDLFFLPPKYSFVTFDTGNYSLDGFSHVLKNNRWVRQPHEGASHGQIWDYDVHIPLFFYAPGRLKPGTSTTVTTQQDLVPTYAALSGAVAPEDARHGKVITEVTGSFKSPPKVILTLVLDQGGWQYFQAHPQSHPHLDALRQKSLTFTQTRITHLDVETGVGHVAIGTGAYPYQHGIISNSFYMNPFGKRIPSVGRPPNPILNNSASLADVWDLQRQNKPVIISYCYADRAAIGMAGHGAMYQGGDKDVVVFYDLHTGKLTTNTDYYQLPPYLSAMTIDPYMKKLVNAQGQWLEHQVNNYEDITKTPAQAWFDGDVYLKLLAQEPIGEDNLTDLLYLTLKSTDACGHAFGYESQECGQTLQAQDQQVQRVVDFLEKKVGRDHILITVTADHGASPLTELSGGQRIKAVPLMAQMNQDLDKLANGVPLVVEMTAAQLNVDDNELQRNHLTLEQLKTYLKGYKVNGSPAFIDVLTKKEVVQEQLKLGLFD